MKTIFISSFHALISRNILETGFLKVITEKHRVILLVPDYKLDYFKRRFQFPNLIVEGVSVALSRTDLFWRKLALSVSPTRTLAIKKQSEYFENRAFLQYLGKIIPSYIFGRLKWSFRFFQRLDAFFGTPSVFASLFEKYKPDFVFTTDTQHEMDVRLIQEARSRSIKTVGMIRSWDNLTAKGILRALPELLVVNNETLVREAQMYNWMDPKKIEVVGIPHYDRYVASITDEECRELFAKFGFDPSRKTVMYAPIGDRFIRRNRLDQMIIETFSKQPINLLVRFPPNDDAPLSLDETTTVARIFVDRPGVRAWVGGKKTNEMAAENDDRLRAEIQLADVVVAGPSTILLDATVFNKPAIAVDFDDSPRPYPDSVHRYYDYDHLRALMAPGAIGRAGSLEELLSFVDRALQNPQVNESSRMQIIREQCYKIDGKSTDRLTKLILSEIEKTA